MVPQEPALYASLSARENLRFWGGLYGLAGAELDRAVDRVLEETGLAGRAKEPVKNFSGGMKRRLNLGIGLVHRPQAVLLDEPTVGIDVQARLNILQVVRDVAAAGTTVLYTTHYLEEVETLCDRIAIMDHGKILAEGTLPELKRQVGGKDLLTVTGTFEAEAARSKAAAVPGAQIVSAESGRLLLSVDGGRGAVEALTAILGRGAAGGGGHDPAAQPEHAVPQPHGPGAARLMRLLLLLVSKDLKRKLRAPLGILVLLAFPLVFAGMLALVFGSSDSPKVRLLVENRDDGFLASALSSAFTSKQMAEHFDVRTVGRGEGEAAIEAGEGSALLVLPERLTQDVLDGKPVTLELVRNPAEGILPEVAEQLARILTEVLDGGARVLREPLDQLRPYLEEGAPAPSDASIATLSIAFKRTIEGAESFVFPPAITLKGAFGTTPKREGGTGSLIFLAVLPGVAVYALFLVGGQRDAGRSRRGDAGHDAAPARGAHRGRHPAGGEGALLRGARAGGAGHLLRRGRRLPAHAPAIPGYLASLWRWSWPWSARRRWSTAWPAPSAEGSTFASAIYLTMGFLGGSFVDVGNLPQTMQAIARWTPFYWATSGYRTLLEKGGGLTDVLPGIAVLSVLGVVLLIAGSFFLRRTVARGGAAA